MSKKTGALTVEEALARILADARQIGGVEDATLDAAQGRVLARPLAARHTQPPFDASAMDGYAVRTADVATLPVTLAVIGESAAGRGFGATVRPGQAVRIFTGAPMPEGADGVVVQEDTKASAGTVTIQTSATQFDHIRRRG
ncbi:MAG TPA: molybdopterin molybdenumtransferase MoeA, partial [Hyphomicrobiaceae bacterium]|nr:molybdopterin molybdenumtransferase MoeA [Hyphomicrobiaceae bacterium]